MPVIIDDFEVVGQASPEAGPDAGQDAPAATPKGPNALDLDQWLHRHAERAARLRAH